MEDTTRPPQDWDYLGWFAAVLREARGETHDGLVASLAVEKWDVLAIERGKGRKYRDRAAELVTHLTGREEELTIRSPWPAVGALLVALQNRFPLEDETLESTSRLAAAALQRVQSGDPAASPEVLDGLLDVYRTRVAQRQASASALSTRGADPTPLRSEDPFERGCRIRAIRVGLGLSREDFGRELERSPETILAYEEGTQPSVAQLEQLEQMEAEAAGRLGGPSRLDKLTAAIAAAPGEAAWSRPRAEPEYLGRFLTPLMAERDLEPWDLQGLWDCTPQQVLDRIAGRANPTGSAISRLITVFDLDTTPEKLRTQYGLKPARSQRTGAVARRPGNPPGTTPTSGTTPPKQRPNGAKQGR